MNKKFPSIYPFQVYDRTDPYLMSRLNQAQFVMTNKFDNDTPTTGISSSPSAASAPRTSRSAWLSRASSGLPMKIFISVFAVLLLTAGAFITVPIVKSRMQKSNLALAQAKYHSHVHNSTGKLCFYFVF